MKFTKNVNSLKSFQNASVVKKVKIIKSIRKLNCLFLDL